MVQSAVGSMPCDASVNNTEGRGCEGDRGLCARWREPSSVVRRLPRTVAQTRLRLYGKPMVCVCVCVCVCTLPHDQSSTAIHRLVTLLMQSESRARRHRCLPCHTRHHWHLPSSRQLQQVACATVGDDVATIQGTLQNTVRLAQTPTNRTTSRPQHSPPAHDG